MIDIVIGVDGTNSQNYRNRSVENFVNAVNATHKIYRKGPQDTIRGSDWVSIASSVKMELDAIARKYRERSFFNGYQCTKSRKSRFRFIMVGHSRGGHIVIHLAAQLKYRTHFMGLYDAVEKTTMKWDESKVIYNVDNIYHAIRDESVGSRTSRKLNVSRLLSPLTYFELVDYTVDKVVDFGNTGIKSGDGGIYVSRKFKTSHGGIGGDVVPFRMFTIPKKDDDSCTVTFFKQSEVQVNKMHTCLAESETADKFIREGARKWGVQI